MSDKIKFERIKKYVLFRSNLGKSEETDLKFTEIKFQERKNSNNPLTFGGGFYKDIENSTFTQKRREKGKEKQRTKNNKKEKRKLYCVVGDCFIF